MRWMLLAAALVPASAAAAPIEFVEQRNSFMLFDDVSESVENGNWFGRNGFLSAYGDVEAGFLAAHPDDSQFLIVYTTWSLPGGVGALYQAVANDVRGIGYENIAPLDAVIPEPYFDDTPNSQVYGFMHMNRWTQYLGGDAGGLDDTRISLVFGQEFGHAWLAFVQIANPGLAAESLLGRSAAHWSFYLDTAGSPVEGHDWVDNGDGTFTALKQDIFEFSDLDLYLMGLLPPTDVQPWFLVADPFDCVDSAQKGGECAPADAFIFQADSYTVTGTRRDITIQDVIDREGPRDPPFGVAPMQWDASFLLIKRPDETLDESDMLLMDAIVERSIDIFNEQTRGLGFIINRTAGEAPPGGDESSGADDGGGPNPGDDGADDGGDSGPGADGGSAGGQAGDGDGAVIDRGCACAATRSPGMAGWGLLMILLGRVTRTRATATIKTSGRGRKNVPTY